VFAAGIVSIKLAAQIEDPRDACWGHIQEEMEEIICKDENHFIYKTMEDLGVVAEKQHDDSGYKRLSTSLLQITSEGKENEMNLFGKLLLLLVMLIIV
jgi:hypothetical protein